MELFDATSRTLEQAIAGAALRQETLAANLANANTPGYVRKDVDFQATLRDAQLDADSGPQNVAFEVGPDGAGAVRADGNGVDVDAEGARLAQNGLLYQALVSAARTRNDIARSAMGMG
jgi:flagellar basal-body rod protein FlgB